MGECSFAYHGANRLGANSLLSCIFDGLFGGTCIKNYITDVGQDRSGGCSAIGFRCGRQAGNRPAELAASTTQGTENPYLLWQEMGKWMTDNCTVVRYNERLKKTLDSCQEWKERYKHVKLSDTGMWTNQNLSFARATRDMILMSEAVLKGACCETNRAARITSRNFRSGMMPNFLKATIATYDPATDSAR